VSLNIREAWNSLPPKKRTTIAEKRRLTLLTALVVNVPGFRRIKGKRGKSRGNHNTSEGFLTEQRRGKDKSTIGTVG